MEFAELSFGEDGTPFAPRYQDVYRSRSGAGQGALVFVEGSDVRGRLRAEGRLSILETGFGLGLNLAATLQAAVEMGEAVSLRYEAIELHPTSPADFERAQRDFAEERVVSPHALGIAEQLTKLYGVLLREGAARALVAGHVELAVRLVIGDGADALSKLNGPYDALYLDGFAPSRNPDLWTAPVFRALAKLARPGTTIATYTVARPVRLGMAAAGFRVEKILGFGDKKFRLVGEYAPAPHGTASPGLREDREPTG